MKNKSDTILGQLAATIRPAPAICSGKIIGVKGPLLIAQLPQAALGDLCYVYSRENKKILSQVVSFHENLVHLAPFANIEGIQPCAHVTCTGQAPYILVGDHLRGQIVNALGEPLNASNANNPSSHGLKRSVTQPPPTSMERVPISKILETGISSIDGLCTLGLGQRIGIFASAGTGKSTLLSMLARNASIDLSVIALIGERGREVQDFIYESLGSAGLERTVVVIATSDEPALRRKLAAYTAHTIAEYFRSQGLQVLLLIDSLTRIARAIREVSLASGEIPVRQGYTTSVYTELPKLLERAGNNGQASITAVYTILTNGEDESDPLSEEIKSLLDGHLVLSAKLAQEGLRPAIDPLTSVSRLLSKLQTPEQAKTTDLIRKILSRLRKDKDILLFGGKPDAELQAALDVESELYGLLNQTAQETKQFIFSMQCFRKITERFMQQLARHTENFNRLPSDNNPHRTLAPDE